MPNAYSNLFGEEMLLFSIGIAFIAALLGFLVGASESPVAGIALTATFGIVATGLALHQKAATVTPNSLPPVPASEVSQAQLVTALKSLGVVLIVFTLTFAGGLTLGVWSKLQSHIAEPQTRLVWQGAQRPTTAKKALDWIMVQRKLKDMGYTDKQVLEIYKIDIGIEKDDDKNIFSSDDQLLSPILSIAPSAITPSQKNHFIANNPLLNRRDGGV